MKSLSKKLCIACLAAIATVCLGLTVLFTGGTTASAATVNLNKAEYFDVANGTFNGLTTAGEAAAGNDLFTIEFPSELNVTRIGVKALYKNANLLGITIPSGVTYIDSYAFNGCTALKEITIPDSVTEVNTRAFEGCTSLSYVKLPENAEFTDLNTYLFNGCTSLLSITIPANITYIGTNAFGGCSRLVEVCNNSSLDISGMGGLNPLNVYSSTSGSSKIQPVDGNGFVFYTDGTVGGKTYLLDYQGGETEVTLPANYNGGYYDVYNEVFKYDTAMTAVTVPANAKINSLGSGSFSGCTALESVNLNGLGISAIENNLFEGCTSLVSIDIPASVTSIGMYAFYGCTSLENVNFNKSVTEVGDDRTEEYLLETIYASAFANCSALEVIEIPDSVKNINLNAFAGCYKLSTVYLPDEATFGDNVFESFDCPLLIAADKDKYDAYLNGSLSDYNFRLTYIVKLILVYGGTPHDDLRLNLGYNYVLQEDGKTWADNGGMPVQEGYKASVWYKESTYKTEVDFVELNIMLINSSGVTLYARTYFQSDLRDELVVNNDLVYNDNEISYENAIGWTSALDNIYDISIADFATFGGVSSVPDKILNAGYYTFKIELKSGYGEWETPLTVPVTVKRAVKDLSSDFHWVSAKTGEDGTLSYHELDPSGEVKTLYFYRNDQNQIIPYTEEIDIKAQATQPKPVMTSYLTYTGETYLIVLQEDKEYGGTFEVDYSGDFSASESGIYKISATIAADPNYEYKFTDGYDAIYRGLEKVDEGQDFMTISKTWYIVAATTNALYTEGGKEYTIASVWTYGDGAPAIPVVAIGSSDELITFELKRSELNKNNYQMVCGNMSYGRFTDVFNTSMPVGDYELTITIKDYTDAEDKFYEGGTFVYKFSIMNSPYTNYGVLAFDVNENGVSEVRYSTTVHFADISGWDKLDTASELHNIPNGSNFWSIYPDYYLGFDVYYSVVSETGTSGGYFTLQDYAGTTENKPRVIPNTVGVYSVSYMVSAPGYVSLTGSYTLIVYEELSLESVKDTIAAMNVVYNGEARTPNIDTDAYRAVYINNDLDADVVNAKAALGIYKLYDYVEAGDYPVALVIRSTHYVASVGCYLYRWEGWQNGPVSTQQYAQITFTINKAENNTRTPLAVTEWKYGEYDPEKNVVSWSTDWVTDVKEFDFELVSLDGSDRYMYSYRNGVNEFAKADYGVYKLVATCPEGTNYKTGTAEIGIVIGAAEITWSTAPYIESWKYGDFEKMFVLPQPVLSSSVYSLQNEIIAGAYFTSVDDYNKNNTNARYSTIQDLIKASGDENGEVPVGKYVLVYSYDAQGNYAQFVSLVNFQVLKADNYWDVTPVVNGWEYGDKSIDYLTYKPDYTPHYGDAKKVVIQYRALDENFNALSGWEYTLADLGLDDYGKLNVGNYEIKATLSGSDNYDEMEFTMRFTVTKASNSWEDIPNVISWSAGRIKSVEDFLTVKPANGSVLITITDSNGKVIIDNELPQDININKLKALGAGSYVLTAYVASSDRYEELKADVDFAIFEDSVSQTAVIALTIVFAVIAIALAVVGVILLIRRDKALEAEFRKMIKAELNRR